MSELRTPSRLIGTISPDPCCWHRWRWNVNHYGHHAQGLTWTWRAASRQLDRHLRIADARSEP